MELGFSGEVAALYARYRRGYPTAVLSAVVDAFCLRENDLVVDLGCGTGQLATPMAHRVRAVIGIDPEPDMLACARSAAQTQGATNVAWMIGQDSDIPMLQSVLGARTVGAVTIGQALHWMDHEALFAALMPLIRRDGGVAVVTNGLPLWLQDTDWSRVLREWLQDWLGGPLEDSCGTDAAAQQRYRNSMSRNGYELHEVQIDYTDELDLDRIVGGVYSALPASLLPPPDERSQIAAQLRTVLEPHQPFIEHVPVKALIGKQLT